MYNFLFGFFYFLLLERNEIPRFSASIVLSVYIGFHFLCLDSIIRYFTGFSIMDIFPEEDFTNKYSYYPIAAIFMVLVYFYFSKSKVEYIYNKYKDSNIHTFKHILFVILAFIFPLAIMVSLSK